MDPLDPCSPPDLRHLLGLTDASGVFQHTERGKPRIEFGYAIDDVARALIVVLETLRLFPASSQPAPPELLRLARLYLRFIERCQQPDGRFHNFLSHQGEFQDDTGSPDSYGRTLWALGVTIANGWNLPDVAPLGTRAARLFVQALPQVHALPYLRSKAFSILGLAAVLRSDDPFRVEGHLRHLVRDLVHAFGDAATDDWPWFEDTLRYSNGGIVFALLSAAEHGTLRTLDDDLSEQARSVGTHALDFLLRELVVDDFPAPIGNRGWYRRGGERALYDQQCLDAAAMAAACARAWTLTKQPRYRDAARTWWSWFFGNNTQHRSLYRADDGGVYDGLTPEGVNEDQGAESVVTFLLAHLILADALCGGQ